MSSGIIKCRRDRHGYSQTHGETVSVSGRGGGGREPSELMEAFGGGRVVTKVCVLSVCVLSYVCYTQETT